MSPSNPRIAFCRRLLMARKAAGLSQKQLGIRVGLDEFVASPRINRYEKGVHEPDISMSRRLANVLNVPVAYLYADDDVAAEMILTFSQLSRRKQQSLLSELKKTD